MAQHHRPNQYGTRTGAQFNPNPIVEMFLGLNQHTGGTTGSICSPTPIIEGWSGLFEGMISGVPPPAPLNQHTGGISGMVTGAPPPASASAAASNVPAYARSIGGSGPPPFAARPSYHQPPPGFQPRGGPGFQPRPRPDFTRPPPPGPGFQRPPPLMSTPRPYSQPPPAGPAPSRPRFSGANTETWRKQQQEQQQNSSAGKFGFPGVRSASPTPVPAAADEERDQVEDARFAFPLPPLSLTRCQT